MIEFEEFLIATSRDEAVVQAGLEVLDFHITGPNSSLGAEAEQAERDAQ